VTPIDSAEARVLGALLEKEATTPEYYPLSLNALVNACNQKSNRQPVVNYDEQTIEDAIERLREQRFALVITGGSRVQKYAQRFSETLNLGRRECALICLLLRGPQTVGELQGRSERIHRFSDLAEVESLLERLDEFVVKLPRQPGQKESRYAHKLSGEVDLSLMESVPPMDRIGQLEAEVANLREEVRALADKLNSLF
jgi:uncharacterized protein YceH (UPF0502 family)